MSGTIVKVSGPLVVANGMSEAAQLLKKAVEMPEDSIPQARPTPVFTLQKQ